jgi:hypothetical protein
MVAITGISESDIVYKDDYDWIVDRIKTTYPFAVWSGANNKYEKNDDSTHAYVSVSPTLFIVACLTEEHMNQVISHRSKQGFQCGIFKLKYSSKVDYMQAVYDIVGRKP